MNDEQFEKAINKIWLFSPSMADQLRARNTAQREALARVEAERDRLAKRLCICQECGGRGEVHTGEYTNEGHWQPPEPVMVECGECGGDGQIGQVTDLDTAQAQLAEAVALLQNIEQRMYGEDVEHRFTDLIADIDRITAQAEQQEATESEYYCKVCGNHGCVSGCHPDYYKQQEAQGAQAGDERAAFEDYVHSKYPKTHLYRIDRPGSLAHGQYDEFSLHVAWGAWVARAALATQPSAGEPVDGVEGFACWLIDHCEGYEIFEEKIQEWVAGYLKSEAYQRVAAPPAAAHGDEAVRKDAEAAYIEMTCQPVLIDGAHHYYLSSERMQAFDRLFSVDVSDAAIRAQVDGGIGDA